MIDTSRISCQVDTKHLNQLEVGVIGVGGSMTKLEALVRCGLPRLVISDFDHVEATNVARQGHEHIGLLKVEAAANRLRRINPDVEILQLPIDVTTLTDEQANAIFANVDLLIFTVDQFAADAWGNRLALRLGKKALWVGIYEGAGAAEIVFWHPGIDSCFRCLMEHRYTVQEQAAAEGRRIDPPSDGTLFQDLMIVDGIAGHIALGLLTMGADNYFGQLIESLGDRNFLQIKLRHDWTLRDSDPVRQQLGVPATSDAYFCWNSMVRRDGPITTPCADCQAYRGHEFREIPESTPVQYERIKPESTIAHEPETVTL